jgi:hypothetical protein
LAARLEVLAAIELDGELPLRAEKVEDERPARMLPAELEFAKPVGAKVPPERGLSVGRISAQLPSARKSKVHGGAFRVNHPIVAVARMCRIRPSPLPARRRADLSPQAGRGTEQTRPLFLDLLGN